MLSVLDIFKIGIGPSSSHTVGPMRIAKRFLMDAQAAGVLAAARGAYVELQGSLALTGVGHGADAAILLGLTGADPDRLDPDVGQAIVARIRESARLTLFEGPEIAFAPRTQLALRGDVVSPLHPNSVCLTLLDSAGATLIERIYFSVGGGFIATQQQLTAPAQDDLIAAATKGPYPFATAAQLRTICAAQNWTIAQVMLANEDSLRSRAETEAGLDRIWAAMAACIARGLSKEGVLPGGLKVERRAARLYRKLQNETLANEREQLLDWLNLYALAVNEENAAGGRVVTAPTNGAAGIIPATIKYYCAGEPDAEEKIRRFLLTAGAIGMLYKQRASISGAEMGCQGEVGVACSMAAAGLAAVWNGTPAQIEAAAEIGMEHNLGLTCDPVGGLVQIPCIERNAMGAVKAVNAARLALRAAESQKVSLDQVIETMRQTGIDMSSKYKETSQGGLAVNVVEC